MAHFLADFTFQPQKWCDKKNTHLIAKEHVYHVLIVFGLSYSAFWAYSFLSGMNTPGILYASVAIAAAHFLADTFKSYLLREKKMVKFLFFADQIFHLFVIFIVVCLLESYSGYRADNAIRRPQTLFFLLSLLLCTKPANIFIKNIMEIYNITASGAKRNNDLPDAGKLIGIIERVLSFILIVSAHFDIVGFIIAAKSILRFRDADTAKTEYLLIGSLLSFGIAILLGIIYLNINKIIY
jgi:hypothetical protein